MKKINSYQLYDMLSKKNQFLTFLWESNCVCSSSKIIIILSIYSRLFVENRLTMITVLFFLFRIQQHLRCALILYLSSSTRLTTHSLSFFPIFKHMGQEVGLSLPEIYVLLQCQPSKTTYTYTAVSFFQIKHSISGHLVSLFSTDVQL